MDPNELPVGWASNATPPTHSVSYDRPYVVEVALRVLSEASNNGMFTDVVDRAKRILAAYFDEVLADDERLKAARNEMEGRR